MTKQFQYAVLSWSSCIEAAGQRPFLAVLLPMNPQAGAPHFIWNQTWQAGLSDTDKIYIQACVEDMNGALASWGIGPISELSVGPIRTFQTGECDEAGIAIIQELLK